MIQFFFQKFCCCCFRCVVLKDDHYDYDNDDYDSDNDNESQNAILSFFVAQYENLRDGFWYIVDSVLSQETQRDIFGSETVSYKNKRLRQRKREKNKSF